MHQPRVVINHAHLRHNLGVLSSLVAPAETMLAVKTNAYGHGLVEVSRTAIESGATALATLEVGAAVSLREAGVTQQLFAWLFSDDEIPLAVTHGIDLGVSRIEQLDRFGSLAQGSTAPQVHLKFDSGLTRNGAMEEIWPDFCRRALELQNSGAVKVVGIWTHLADASTHEDHASLERFDESVRIAREIGLSPDFLHAGASSFGLQPARTRYDFVRFGIAAYGISPLEDHDAPSLDLRPVMTMLAPVVAVDSEGITVGAGFGHGVLTGTHAERIITLNGRGLEVVSVNVDHMRVAPSVDVNVGDTAIVFGEGGPSAEQLGAWCNTIGDEVVTSVSSALPREHLNLVASN